MNNYNCELMNNEINEQTCFDIHMVVEKLAPKRTAPQQVFEKENWREICLNCPNHRED